jgi:vacuolar-type H+-ATPase subunit D/Vma8
MDPVTIAAAISAVLKAYDALAGTEEKRAALKKRFTDAQKMATGAAKELETLLSDICESYALDATRARMEKAAQSNPAMRKP